MSEKPSEIELDEIRRKYEILSKMGEGGMGAIYKVRHKLLEEVRVIKLIRSQFREDENLQARFLREARVATQLQHPNIAHMYDFSVGDDGTAYIAMEFIDGVNLSELIKEGMPPLEDTLEISRQTLDALGYLHGRQLIHRDISPDNIMISRDDAGRPTVKLIDLGIAKPLDNTEWDHTRTGFFVGKVRYVAPERLGEDKGTAVDERSDLYSYGIVLYELLTGCFPINGTDDISTIAGHLFHPPKSFGETDPIGRVPEHLRQVVLKALAKKPEQRFARAADFARALGGGESVLDELDDGPATLALSAEALLEAPTVGGSTATAPLAGTTPVEATQVASALPASAKTRHRSPGKAGPPRRFLLAALGLGAVLILVVAGWRFGVAEKLFTGGGQTAGGPEDAGLPASALAGLDFGKYHALVIGNDAYTSLPPLETAANDAREVARLLETKFGFAVTLITDASRYDILTALNDVVGGLTGNDNLLVYYAGHGWLDEESQSGYWQPVDAEPGSTANWISTKYEISAVLGSVGAKQLLVVADSCYAGALSDLDTFEPESSGDRLSYVRDALERRSRLALTSGGLSPVLDRGGGNHSIFSSALLETLGRSSGVVEVSALFQQVRERVATLARDYGIEQAPQLTPIPLVGDEGGDFFFVPVS